MKKKTFFGLILVLGSGIGASPAQALLTVSDLNSSLTAMDLVNTLFGGFNDITINNAQFVGSNVQAGTFTNGLSTGGLSFDTGIVLSSGRASALSLVHNTVSGGASHSVGTAGDARLNALLGLPTFDAAVLEFDFVPTGTHIQFSYVFGSTEYNNYVNTQFNDAIAFFVNDINYALVPDTTTPVAINNVNCGRSGGSAPGVGGVNCDLFNDNRNNNGTVGSSALLNLGGYTDTLSFIASVNPNVRNTMRLVIADASDRILDSAVFLTFNEPPRQSAVEGDNSGIPESAPSIPLSLVEPEQAPPAGNSTPISIPEPTSLALLGLGLFGFGTMRRHRTA